MKNARSECDFFRSDAKPRHVASYRYPVRPRRRPHSSSRAMTALAAASARVAAPARVSNRRAVVARASSAPPSSSAASSAIASRRSLRRGHRRARRVERRARPRGVRGRRRGVPRRPGRDQVHRPRDREGRGAVRGRHPEGELPAEREREEGGLRQVFRLLDRHRRGHQRMGDDRRRRRRHDADEGGEQAEGDDILRSWRTARKARGAAATACAGFPRARRSSSRSSSWASCDRSERTDRSIDVVARRTGLAVVKFFYACTRESDGRVAIASRVAI